MKYFKVIAWNKCPFCIKAKQLLIESGEPFEFCSVDDANELLEYYKTIYSHKTVPMIVIKEVGVNDKFIGGYTDLVEFIANTGSGDYPI
jgi:glutaredoxin 3